MGRCLALIAAICFTLTACTTTKKFTTDKNGPPPKLLAPSVKKIWIPPQLKDGGQEWVGGHFIYRIERGTYWSR